MYFEEIFVSKYMLTISFSFFIKYMEKMLEGVFLAFFLATRTVETVLKHFWI